MFTVGRVRPMRRTLLAAALALLGACGDQRPTEPVTPAAPDSPDRLLGFSGPKLVECPTDETLTKSATIGPLGGVLSLGATSITVPIGALLGETELKLTIPASRYVEIDVTANGLQHFVFEEPVVVSIDYWRCNRSDVLFKPLTAWYIDSDTKDLLERMPSFDNKLTRQVTFTTLHLSGYAIAF